MLLNRKDLIIYARYSSHAQRDQSIADQIAVCEPLEATLLNRSGDQRAESCDSADPVDRQAVIALERFDGGSESVSENK